MKVLWSIISLMALSGCAGSAYDVEHQTPEQLQSANTDMVCMVAAEHHGAVQIAELVRRGLIRPQYEQDVASGQLAIGMTTREMQCTYFPLVVAANNVSSVGQIIVWNDGSNLDVITTNGIVTTINQ